ncbi:YpiF family protein [Paenibacillus sp. N1-5-1-14]|uniref:YpiF family protein n=1 Tax=Paenibacillus radicibacter TaxID=2972488 RepID=UPI00215944B6|nr:YpiF family protein [Paenibacillus radicibacter]MCR8642265.1 YpiF family protein [Paenibacillus radicibacter]
MKFSDVESSKWEELKPYLDTCLLPITGLSGSESPWQATDKLELLRDAMDCIEIPFRGRVITYPALHYVLHQETGQIEQALDELCHKLKEDSFKYVIVLTTQAAYEQLKLQDADIFLYVNAGELQENPELIHENIAKAVQAMWSAMN